MPTLNAGEKTIVLLEAGQILTLNASTGAGTLALLDYPFDDSIPTSVIYDGDPISSGPFVKTIAYAMECSIGSFEYVIAPSVPILTGVVNPETFNNWYVADARGDGGLIIDAVRKSIANGDRTTQLPYRSGGYNLAMPLYITDDFTETGAGITDGFTIAGDDQRATVIEGFVSIGPDWIRDTLQTVTDPTDPYFGRQQISNAVHLADMYIDGGLALYGLQSGSTMDRVRIKPETGALNSAALNTIFCNTLQVTASRMDGGGINFLGWLIDTCPQLHVLGGGANSNCGVAFTKSNRKGSTNTQGGKIQQFRFENNRKTHLDLTYSVGVSLDGCYFHPDGTTWDYANYPMLRVGGLDYTAPCVAPSIIGCIFDGTNLSAVSAVAIDYGQVSSPTEVGNRFLQIYTAHRVRTNARGVRRDTSQYGVQVTNSYAIDRGAQRNIDTTVLKGNISRNLIANGSMQVGRGTQRNISTDWQIGIVDGWEARCTNVLTGSVGQQKLVTPYAGYSPNSLRIAGITTSDAAILSVRTKISADRAAKLANTIASISGYTWTTGGALPATISLYSAGSKNDYTNLTLLATATMDCKSPQSEIYIDGITTADTTNGLVVQIDITIPAAQSSAINFEFGDIQLEACPNRTSFETRTAAEELMECAALPAQATGGVSGLVDPTTLGAVGDGVTSDAAAMALIPAASRVFVAKGKNYIAPSFYGATTMSFEGDGKINGITVEAKQRYPERVPVVFPSDGGVKWPVVVMYDRGRWTWLCDYRGIFDKARQSTTATHLYMAVGGAAGAAGTKAAPYGNATDAMKGIAAAAANVANIVLHIQPGVYLGWQQTGISPAQYLQIGNTNVSIVCEDWQAVAPSYTRAYFLTGINGAAVAWTSIGNGQWQATVAPGAQAIIDSLGCLGRNTDLMNNLTLAANAASVVRGTYYADPVTNLVTVQLQDGRQPDANIWITTNVNGYGFFWPRSAGAFYAEGIEWIGQASISLTVGQTTVTNGYGSICYVDCGVFYNPLGSAFRVHDQAWTAYIRCAAAFVFNDLFSTFGANRPIAPDGTVLRPKQIEFDCRGHSAGWPMGRAWSQNDAIANRNISTAHYASDVLSVNTSGGSVYGPAYGYVQGVRAFIVAPRSSANPVGGAGPIEALSVSPQTATMDRVGMVWAIELQLEPVDGSANNTRDVGTQNAGDVVALSNPRIGYSVGGAGAVIEYFPTFSATGGDVVDRPLLLSRT